MQYTTIPMGTLRGRAKWLRPLALPPTTHRLHIEDSTNLRTIQNNFFRAASLAGANEFVTLEYELMATQESGQFDVKAIHARLAFEEFYSNAAEKYSNTNAINNIPRWATWNYGQNLSSVVRM
jgi:hypothetical protein